MKPSITVPTEKLTEEPYASVVCYPRANPSAMQDRIIELQQLGVTAVEFTGKTLASNIPVLGKGYVGVVAVAFVNGQKAALKMRRMDADRENLEHEAELLVKANGIRVGPKFLAVSRNFLLMQLIDGDLLQEWLETGRGKELVRKVLVDILEQCWRLDEAGLDHGELSKAPKHLLVNEADEPFIVDFETASLDRRVINVTSVCQFLFQGNSKVAGVISAMFGKKDRTYLIGVLKSYKKERNRKNFEEILKIAFP